MTGSTKTSAQTRSKRNESWGDRWYESLDRDKDSHRSVYIHVIYLYLFEPYNPGGPLRAVKSPSTQDVPHHLLSCYPNLIFSILSHSSRPPPLSISRPPLPSHSLPTSPPTPPLLSREKSQHGPSSSP